MKAKDIHVGGEYLAKVSGKIVPVKVLREKVLLSGRGTHWICRNTTTGREIEVKSCQRFRSRVPTAGDIAAGKTFNQEAADFIDDMEVATHSSD